MFKRVVGVDGGDVYLFYRLVYKGYKHMATFRVGGLPQRAYVIPVQ